MGSSTEDFVGGRVYRIPGFLHPSDAMALSGIADWQNRNDIVGSIAEIGVFYGRSFSLLATFLKPEQGEVAVACDLFDIGQREEGDSDQLRDFRSNMARAGLGDVHLKVHAGDSGKLSVDDFLSIGGPVRLFSVDGGHEAHHVAADSRIAAGALTDAGVIAFDDFFNSLYPDVTFEVLRQLRGPMKEFAPFLQTRNKLYVCRREMLATYTDVAMSMKLWAGGRRQQFAFLDGDIVYISQSLPNRLVYQGMSRIGLGALTGGLLKATEPRYARQ